MELGLVMSQDFGVLIWGKKMEDHPQPSGFNSNQGNLFILKSDEILIICNVADYKMLPSSQ